jgi:hypothetical protein
VKDFLRDAFPPILGRDFFDAMTELRKLLLHTREGDAVRSVPGPCETRWTSLGEFIEYIACHQDRICAFLARRYPAEQGRPPAASLPFEIGFDRLVSCFRLLNAFVRWTKGRDPRLIGRPEHISGVRRVVAAGERLRGSLFPGVLQELRNCRCCSHQRH